MQEVCPFPVDDHKAERGIQDSIIKTNVKRINKKEHRLGMVSKKLLEGLY